MALDENRIDDAVLALLYLTVMDDRGNWRAWKSHPWDALDRLYEKGLISNPRSKAKSVVLSHEAMQRSKELATELFGQRA